MDQNLTNYFKYWNGTISRCILGNGKGKVLKRYYMLGSDTFAHEVFVSYEVACKMIWIAWCLNIRVGLYGWKYTMWTDRFK